ncbi:hypothetical protein ACNTMW_14180 [Planosporangium sp. 12N6]|uniref:hypothetical protein n=1 Tax=Planosporangium spinosum TaxID=3402278 RepID=UPI003CF18D6F
MRRSVDAKERGAGLVRHSGRVADALTMRGLLSHAAGARPPSALDGSTCPRSRVSLAGSR